MTTAPVETFFRSPLGAATRGRDASSTPTRCRPASGPARRRVRDQGVRASSTSACSSATTTTPSSAALLHPQRARGRARRSCRAQGRARPAAVRGREQRQRERRHRRARGSRWPRRCRQRRPTRSTSNPRALAVASTGVIGQSSWSATGARGRRRGRADARRRMRGRLRARDPDHATAGRSAPASSWRFRRARCGSARRPRARGMISPSFATMLCFVETDAAIDPADARAAARCGGRALVRADLGGRPAVDERLAVHDRERRVGRRGRAGHATTS